ncbi:hypothetical protein QPK87_31345 [Kamptonema cortianum]|nr:hypothetical protein [Geitlerinema splendidum]MDK3161020.1 hypothetical protein [Kamptonema cortianum]
MAAAIELAYGFDSEFVPSGGGILEVEYEGQVVWTNDDNRGYKPSNEEVLEAMKTKVG